MGIERYYKYVRIKYYQQKFCYFTNNYLNILNNCSDGNK